MVNGYIKQTEKELLDNDMIIPSLVITTCILFYHLGEFFTIWGDDVTVEDDLTTVKIKAISNTLRIEGYVRNTAYGNIIISKHYPCIYSWTIQILQLDVFDTFLGIESSNKTNTNTNYTRIGGNKFYAITHKLRKISHIIQTSLFIGGNLTMMNVGDTVRIEINTMDKTMGIYINDIYKGIVFDNLDFNNESEYYLAVSLCTDETVFAHSVKLLDFSQIYISNSK